MTTFIARHGDRTASPSAALGTGLQRLAHGFVSMSIIVRDAVGATRALNDAHTAADRRAVAARFAADPVRSGDRSAA